MRTIQIGYFVGGAVILSMLGGCNGNETQQQGKPPAEVARTLEFANEPVALVKDTPRSSKQAMLVSVEGASSMKQQRRFGVVVDAIDPPDRPNTVDAEVMYKVNAVPADGTPSDSIDAITAGPLVQLNRGYLYARGWRPMVRTVRGTAISNGTRIVAEVDDSRTDVVHRYYHLFEEVETPDLNPVLVYVFTSDDGTCKVGPGVDPVKLARGEYAEITAVQGALTITGPLKIENNDERAAFVKTVVNDKGSSQLLDTLIQPPPKER